VELVSGVIGNLLHLSTDKDIAIRWEPQEPIVIPVDGPKISQVVLNLIDNAIKYTKCVLLRLL
jgi:signal transduction histidine kinase